MPNTRGFSPRNLVYMRTFAKAYPAESFAQQVVARLPWGHHIRILDRIRESGVREWYVRGALEHGWNRDVLVHQIDSRLHERQGKALTNFSRTLPREQSDLAREMTKDPYSFEFLQAGADLDERALESGLIDKLQKFLIELGRGFAFVGRQVRIEVGGEDYFIDLLFYHVRLHCYVVVELKTEEFKPEHAGKMNFYLSAIDHIVRHPEDRPSIGMILCRSKNRLAVEYSLRDLRKPIGVSSYDFTGKLPARLRSELPDSREIADGLKA